MTVKVHAIIEARMSSTRLPGKMLMSFGKLCALEVLIGRLRQVGLIEEIIVATSTNPMDDLLENIAIRSGVKCFRGSEEDVFRRVTDAIRVFDTEIVVQATGDNIFVDPLQIEQMLSLFINESKWDLMTNDFVEESIILGQNIRIYKSHLFEKILPKVSSAFFKENVEAYFFNNLKEFIFYSYPVDEKLRRKDIRLTLDTPKDLYVMSQVFSHFNHVIDISIYDIITYLDTHPKIKRYNSSVVQKSLDCNENSICL